MPIKDNQKDEYIRLAWPAPRTYPFALTAATSKAKSLTDALFALEEPWQGRFLNLVADLATSSTWDGHQPTRDEVLAWLSADLDLYREVKLLLEAWWRPTR